LDGTDVWFKTLWFPQGTRVYYQLSPDDPLQQRPPGVWARAAQADPLNPRFDRDDPKLPLQRKRSLLELPGALAQPWFGSRPGVPKYSPPVEQKISSTALKASRTVRIYTPPGYSKDAGTAYPTMYLFDGEDPDGYVFSTSTMENLLAERKIPAVVVIRIQNPSQAVRSHDLECSDDYATFLNNELVPFIRANYNVSAKPERTLIGGYSLGGLMAAYTAFRHPETFGMVLSQSGSFWYEPSGHELAPPDWLVGLFAQAPRLNLRFYLDAGLYELDFTGRGGNILVPNRHLRDVLIAKGYELHYQEFPGEHDPINWRGTIADGLIALLGPFTAAPER
jgi:enterochelin esterase-like enzyme